MHYKNGRLAKLGDDVIGRIYNRVAAGRIEDLNPNAETCNAVLVTPKLGGMDRQSVNIRDLIHAEDALTLSLAALESAAACSEAQSPPTPEPGG